MPRASRRADVPPRPPDLAVLAGQLARDGDRAAAVTAALEQVAEAARLGMPLPEGLDAHAVALLIAGARQIGSGLHAVAAEASRLSLESRLASACLAAERAEGRQEGAQAVRGRHRQDRRRKPSEGQLTLIPGGRTAVATVGLAASIAVAATAATNYTDLAQYLPLPVAHHAAAAAPASLAPADAVPLLPSSPSQSPPGGYVPRHARPAPDAASASPAPSSPVTVPPSSPSWSPPPPPVPAPSVAAADEYLDVQTDHLAVGPLMPGQVTFSAVGGAVSWSASAPAGLVLSASSGVLGDGQAVVIEVSVQVGAAAGSGVITITDGDGRSVSVPVTWAAVPAI